MYVKTVIGIIGDGQLARLLIDEGNKYLKDVIYFVYPLVNEKESICKNLDNTEIINDLYDLFKYSDFVTYEYENLDIEKLEKISNIKKMTPSLETLKNITSKINQKIILEEIVPLANYKLFKNKIDMINYLDSVDNKNSIIIKKDRGGYNGQGVFTYDDIIKYNLFSSFDTKSLNNGYYGYYCEEKIDIKYELSVICLKSNLGLHCYNPVKMIFNKKNTLLEYSDNNNDKDINNEAIKIVKKAINKITTSNGLYVTELFITNDNKILVNEISSRPHNSGHHTIECAEYSQYLELLNILITGNHSIDNREIPQFTTFNILGSNFKGKYVLNPIKLEQLCNISNIKLYNYGKKLNKPNRKLGHLTYLGNNKREIIKIRELLKNICIPKKDLECNILFNDHSFLSDNKKDIGIIMGSISDFETVKPTIDILKLFDVSFSVEVISAHRMPNEMCEYGITAKDKGLKVIIACAGGAAHLPGMVASLTTVPVIGLPVKTSTLNGIDSLYSIVQMPRGVPVATVAIGNGVNAALLALRMLSIINSDIDEKLKDYAELKKLEAIESNNKIKY